MCAVSFIKEALKITIHNLYSGLELTSPAYFSTGTTYCVPPNQQTNASNTVEASFGIDSKQKVFEGALLYKLKRKHNTKTSNQPNNSNASIKDIATSIYLLVTWNVRDYAFASRVCLIECTDKFT
jgi:hypothetical protein